MQKRRFAPSPALVISLIALFVALGGTSYAAVSAALPKNSVGTKQLKNGAVTAAKLHALGPAKVVGAAGAPGYQNAWGAPDAPEEGVSFYKDPWGIVHLQGNATHTGAVESTIFTLPPGYRPAGDLFFTTYGNASVEGEIQINGNGNVGTFHITKDYVGLSNITFRAGL